MYDDTSNNYKSAEQANSVFLTYTLNPLLRCIEAELARKLISPELSGRYKIEFARNTLFAADPEMRARLQKMRLETGTASVNELRQEDGRPPVELGDVPLVSANLRPLTDITTQTQTTKNDNETYEN